VSAIGYLAISLVFAFVAMPVGYRLAFRTEDSWQAAKGTFRTGQPLSDVAEYLGKGLWKIVGLSLMPLSGAAVLINILVLAGVITPAGS
jgi:hypothetical protein